MFSCTVDIEIYPTQKILCEFPLIINHIYVVQVFCMSCQYIGILQEELSPLHRFESQSSINASAYGF